MNIPLKVFLAIGCCLVIGREATASLHVSFTRVTNNNVEDLSGQLHLEILDSTEANTAFGLSLAANQVLFVFTNNVGIASNIAEIYIDAGPILGQVAVHNSLGGFTSFSGPAVAPPNLPGGASLTPAFTASVGLSADVSPGPPGNGINAASDILGISYTVSGGLADIAAALNLDPNNPDYVNDGLRIGLHVRSIGAKDDSDSYVSTGSSNIVPEPASLLVWGGLACASLCIARRQLHK